jgi:hypothetical protein
MFCSRGQRDKLEDGHGSIDHHDHCFDHPRARRGFGGCEPLHRGDRAIGANTTAGWNNLALGPTGQQSVGAQLGYQPTPDSVREAEQASKHGVVAILNRAKAFDAEGKTKECMELVSTAKLRLQ